MYNKDKIGAVLLGTASALLVALAGAMGYVSYSAQAEFVENVKGPGLDVHLEALGLDVASVVFALLGLVSARLGKRALTERALNVACVGASVGMNALASPPGSASAMVAYVMPAVLYAATSDRLIATVRMRFLEGPTEALPEVQSGPETASEPSPVVEVPQELPDDSEAVEEPSRPTDEEILASLPSTSARIRWAMNQLDGVDTPADSVQEFLAERGCTVNKHNIYTVRGQERKRLQAMELEAALKMQRELLEESA